jgi:phosphoribosylaminoimidazole-succinocarboxamide synthase
MTNDTLSRTEIPELPVRRGKVRDVFDLGDRLLIVSTDRISAFDWILPTAIPDKGRILTQLSLFWFERLGVPHHVLSADIDSIPLPGSADRDALRGRSMIVRKADVVPFECVARGYLAGTGYRDYQRTGSICGVSLPAGLVESGRLSELIFTPATKATEGHDENVPFERMSRDIGATLAEKLRGLTLQVYASAASYALERGIIVADTKLEWGLVNGEVILVDEVLTPDSSRFWPLDGYLPGQTQPSFDKQFVRDWLESTSWDKNSPPPPLPDDVVRRTRDKYLDVYQRLVGHPLDG